MVRREWYCEDVLSGKTSVSRVWEDEQVLALHHPTPQSEIHVVVIPKKHISSILDAAATDGSLLASMVSAVQQSAVKFALDRSGFYVRVNAASEGVTPHMHWHILGPGIP
jgi:histidine triad (HIT) family protein